MCMYITVCSLYMYELLYCNVCTLCTACSGVVCGNSIVICCIVSPPWPPQGPSNTSAPSESFVAFQILYLLSPTQYVRI